jgi:hypothetical protein
VFALVAALALAAPAQAAYPGLNGRLAFDGASGIATINPDGSDLETLTASSDRGGRRLMTTTRPPRFKEVTAPPEEANRGTRPTAA